MHASGRGPAILVARPDHLGDLLLTLPAVALLKRRVRDAFVACVVPDNLAPIARRAVDVDEVLTSPFTLADPPPPMDSPLLANIAGRIERFDLALLPRPRDPWSGAAVARAAIPFRVGHQQPQTMPFLTHAYPERNDRHVAHEAVALASRAARLLGGKANERRAGATRTLIRLRPEDHVAAEAVLAELTHGRAPVVLHPAAGWPLKSWPVERWIAVARRLRARLGGAVLVVGQPHDAPLLEQIADGSGAGVAAVSAIGVAALAGLHARARVVLGIDSGALHLAALVGAPVVGLFGPFGVRRVRPLAPPERSDAIAHRLPCSPCGTLDTPPCGARREPACLVAITPDEVVAGAARLARPDARSARLSA